MPTLRYALALTLACELNNCEVDFTGINFVVLLLRLNNLSNQLLRCSISINIASHHSDWIATIGMIGGDPMSSGLLKNFRGINFRGLNYRGILNNLYRCHY